MKKKSPLGKNISLSLKFILFSLFVSCFLSSCKKDLTSSATDNDVAKAQRWYSTTYSKSSGTVNSISSFTTRQQSDYSKIVDVDWAKAQTYLRFNQNVVEAPIINFNSLQTSLKTGPFEKTNSGNKYSRSSVIILQDGLAYTAYVMTIIADSAYIKNDFTKLQNNTYKSHDKDFAGWVLYYNINGKFLKGWYYKNGAIAKTLNTSAASSVNNISKSVSSITKTFNNVNCIDWYADVYSGDDLIGSYYLGTTCASDPGDGSGGGGGNIGGGGGGGGFPPLGDSGDATGGTPTTKAADHTVKNGPVPPMTTTDTQTGQTCVFKVIEWVSEYFGGNITAGNAILYYSQSNGLDVVSVINEQGVILDNLSDLINHYFSTVSISPNNIHSAIDAGDPVMGTIFNSQGDGHEVMITGYNNNGTVEYFDPAAGSYFTIPPGLLYYTYQIKSAKLSH